AAGSRMHREQPALHFLYTQISDLNPARSLAELGALLRAAGAVTPDAVATLDLPVLFIVGTEDIVIPPLVLERAAAHFKNARVELIPAAGHSVYFERPAVFNAIVERFLMEE
ncbi:MAG TPA: alpha/beta hydrolase, partial [Candidatus Kryptonia bacterium]|nr:alpha/beta hydrolase [Candidatus Kryptonia bacterium]